MADVFSLQGKTALITGGGTGIGRAIAIAFAQAGARVVVAGRREQPLIDTVRDIGKDAAYQILDVADLAKIPEVISQIESRHGGIDILVNNAGVNMKKPPLEVSDADFASIVDINLNAVFALSREAARGMSTRGRGCILNISSMAALYALPRIPAYAASKTAIVGLTRQMALDLAPLGIRVNAIAPGFIYSDMTAKAFETDPERKAKVLARTPMGRMGQPEEIASAAVYLCSDAASFITGVNLAVDGGNSIGF